MKRGAILILTALAIGILAGPTLLSGTINWLARAKADRMLAGSATLAPDKQLLAVAKAAHNEFTLDASPFVGTLYAKAQRMLDIEYGALEMLLFRGQCSELSRAVTFLFSPLKLQAKQHDIVGPHTGHSAISVTFPDKRRVYLDPFLGVVFSREGRLLSLSEAQSHLRNGVRLAAIAQRLSHKYDMNFYRTITQAVHAQVGEKLEIAVRFPVDRKTELGSRDDNSQDVLDEGGNQGLTSHLFYVGNRFTDTFSLKLSPLTADRDWEVALDLVTAIDPSRLPASNVEPHRASGKHLVYHMKAGQSLRLNYEAMGWHWYDVDRLIVRPATRAASAL